MTTKSTSKKLRLRGAIKPRLHSPLLKGKTMGDQIAELAEKIKVPLLPWQKFVLDDMMKVDAKGNFVRKSNLILVARQNGKTHLARMRVIWGLFYGNEKNHLIMSSNRGMALTSFRDIAWTIEHNDFLKSQVKAIRYANGTESIELLNGARLDVVAATRDGSRGRTADFLWIDELREIEEEAFRAATPVTRARPNSQSLFTSNAGDAFSTVLNDMRERALSYPPKSFGFYEYSAPQYCKIEDRAAWALANPALGHTITEDAIEESIATSPIESTRTETLCQWIDSLQSPWPHGVLEATSNSELTMSPGPLTYFAFDVSPSRRNASLVAGQLLPDGKIGFGLLQTWESAVAVDDLKIAVDVKSWCEQYMPRGVMFDKYTTASIADRLQNSGVMTEDVSGQRFYQACGDLLDALVNGRVVHSGQEELVAQFNNCAAKVNDSAWRIVKRKSAGDVSAPISVAMVVSQLLKPQSTPQIYSA
jgi:phage terminase large subunit-like protein